MESDLKAKQWWQTGHWREPARFEPRADFIVSYYNPECKHERCSHDIVNCEHCLAYSQQRENARNV